MLIPTLFLMYLIITKKDPLENHFSKKALTKLSISNQYFTNKTRNIILFLSLIFMIIALARPVTNEQIQNIESNLNPLIIAIDVSKSMKATDLYPNRLEFAKKKLLNILDSSKSEAIGLVLFAKSSFLLSAVSQDFNSLKILINNLDSGVNFDNGTNIFSTLETTKKLLRNYSNKNLLLLTDGGDEENFDSEIKFANENNINIYILALATQKGSPIKEENGNFLVDENKNIVNVKLNGAIKDLALKTNGGYIDFTLDNSDINQILDDINLKSKKELINQKNYKTYTELFYYPLAIGIFLLFMAFSSLPSFSKNKIFSSIIVICLAQLPLFSSSILDFKTIKDANTAYENNQFQEASKEFSKLDSNAQRDYDLANSYYKSNDYDKAIDLYKNINSSSKDLEFKKLHNLGNAYAKKEDFQNAINSYEEALKIQNDPKTRENLELVKKILNDKKEQNNNQQNGQKQENKEEKQNEQEKKNQQSENSKAENKENKKEESKISNENSYEEEKWLKQIENQKTNSLLKKMDSQNASPYQNNKPW